MFLCCQHWSPLLTCCIASPTMSHSNICARGKHNSTAFIFHKRTVFGGILLHDTWLPAEQPGLFMHMKFQCWYCHHSTVHDESDQQGAAVSELWTQYDGNRRQFTAASLQIHKPTMDSTILILGDNRSGSNACTSSPEYVSASWEQDSVLTRLLSRFNVTMC